MRIIEIAVACRGVTATGGPCTTRLDPVWGTKRSTAASSDVTSVRRSTARQSVSASNWCTCDIDNSRPSIALAKLSTLRDVARMAVTS